MAHVPYERVADTDWTVWRNDDGKYSWDQVRLAVLMDIRRELRRLNALLQCENFRTVPATLRQIARHTESRIKRTNGKKAKHRS